MNKNIKRILTAIIIILTVTVAVMHSYDNNNKKSSTQINNNHPSQAVSSTQQKDIKTESQIIIKQALVEQENNLQTALNKELNETKPSRGSNVDNKIDFTLTFYSGLEEENGGFKDINCNGNKLQPGMVANNVLPQGTKIYTEEFGILTVADRGGSDFSTIHRLDVYIPRNKGESDGTYKKRVNSMGKVRINGYIVK